ncbi:MAG TPA: prenyltransferase/squalene oxidase repeat-containing protein [Planctomycetota bacterium]|nr:prenyltransferase/squalene oxidase repeat-containing protein [Planctomycetota bacterium]
MHQPRLLLAALLCFALGPAIAQDGGDDDSGIEVSEDPKPGEEKPPPKDDGYDPDETKKKNVGLAGGGEENDDDPNAPKVKGDLQTRINEAIAKGVEALKKMQDKDGSWGPIRATQKYDNPNEKGDFVRDELGPTAWALYTLAKCGVKLKDPVMKKGLQWIGANTEVVFDVVGGKPDADASGAQKGAGKKKGTPRSLSSYESAAIVLMIEAIYQESAKLTGKQSKRRLYSDNPLKAPDRSKVPEEVWKRMHERILWLTVGRHPGRGTIIHGQQNLKVNGQAGSKGAGGWRYGQANGDADLSATQFVLLALRAASQAGYPIDKVSPESWEAAAQFAKNCQKPDGGFGYQVGGPSYASMTACGVGSLLICKEQMDLSEDKKAPPWIDDSIKRGMEWLDKNFDAETNSGAERPELFYYLYGVERVGDLSGRKEFNGKDWYLRGAMLLLDRQEGDGKWSDPTGYPPTDVLGTCFALLFLKRATVPVVTFSEPEKGE